MKQSFSSSGLNGYRELVTKLGGDPQSLVQQLGIAPNCLDSDEVWIAHEKLIYLYEYTAEQLAQPDFGLLMARQSNLGELGALAVAMQNSGTVGQAQGLAVRYFNTQTTVAKFDLHIASDESRLELNFDLPNTPPGSLRHMEDYTLGFTHRQVRMLSGDNYRLLGVELRHSPICAESVYEKFFSAPVQFNKPHSCLVLATKTLESPLSGTSDILRKMAMNYLTAQNPSANPNISERVELAIRRSLGTENCNRDAIAAALAMHPRTLQRRLKEEGESFNSLLDSVRAKLAEYYLRETELPLAHISLLLGYREQSIFSRRCRHWFNVSASAMRKQ